MRPATVRAYHREWKAKKRAKQRALGVPARNTPAAREGHRLRQKRYLERKHEALAPQPFGPRTRYYGPAKVARGIPPGWGIAPRAPSPERRSVTRLLATVLAVPHLAAGIQSRDLIERFACSPTTASRTVQFARWAAGLPTLSE